MFYILNMMMNNYKCNYNCLCLYYFIKIWFSLVIFVCNIMNYNNISNMETKTKEVFKIIKHFLIGTI